MRMSVGDRPGHAGLRGAGRAVIAWAPADQGPEVSRSSRLDAARRRARSASCRADRPDERPPRRPAARGRGTSTTSSTATASSTSGPTRTPRTSGSSPPRLPTRPHRNWTELRPAPARGERRRRRPLPRLRRRHRARGRPAATSRPRLQGERRRPHRVASSPSRPTPSPLDRNPEFDTDDVPAPLPVARHPQLGLRLRPGHPRPQALRKRTEVLGGYDPANYTSEWTHAPAADGTRSRSAWSTARGRSSTGRARCCSTGTGRTGRRWPSRSTRAGSACSTAG